MVRRLPQMQEVVGSNPNEGKICFSHFTLLEWNVENCFVKLIKPLKINRKNYFVWNDDILLNFSLIMFVVLGTLHSHW